MTAPAWTPDMPLRSDATDGQMALRAGWLSANAPDTRAQLAMVAREFAAACVEQAMTCGCGEDISPKCHGCEYDE